MILRAVSACLLGLAAAHAFAQAQPAAACERKPDAPAWLPCGPDRVLSAADMKAFFKENAVTKMVIKGGTSGKIFYADFHPDGKLDSGRQGGMNIGKDWTLEGDKLCRNFYQYLRGPQCGPFELKEGVLYLVDVDNSRNPITSVEFVPK